MKPIFVFPFSLLLSIPAFAADAWRINTQGVGVVNENEDALVSAALYKFDDGKVALALTDQSSSEQSRDDDCNASRKVILPVNNQHVRFVKRVSDSAGDDVACAYIPVGDRANAYIIEQFKRSNTVKIGGWKFSGMNFTDTYNTVAAQSGAL